MQRDKTLRFWDEYYIALQNDPSKEWILEPSAALLDAIGEQLPRKRGGQVMEIGCGSSCLSRDLWKHRHQKWTGRSHYGVLATDVSPVCIEQNMARDAEIIRSSQDDTDGLAYKVLNVLEPNHSLSGRFDMILDKGCLDTFMFRSQQRGPNARQCSPLLRTLLDNIHYWLKHNDGGKYIVLTPRSKIKSLRDYAGFSSVTKMSLDESKVALGDFDGDVATEEVFLYICERNNQYKAGLDDPFPDRFVGESPESRALVCPSCGITFEEFFKGGKDKKGRGETYWSRRWNGHIIHCKKDNKVEKT